MAHAGLPSTEVGDLVKSVADGVFVVLVGRFAHMTQMLKPSGRERASLARSPASTSLFERKAEIDPKYGVPCGGAAIVARAPPNNPVERMGTTNLEIGNSPCRPVAVTLRQPRFSVEKRFHAARSSVRPRSYEASRAGR